MPLPPDHHHLASRRLNQAPSSLLSSIVTSSALARTDPHKNGRHEAQTAFSTRLKSALAVTAGGWTRDSAGHGEQLSASRVDAETDSFIAPCLGTANMTALATAGILCVDLLRHPVSRILNSHQVVPLNMDRYPLARVPRAAVRWADCVVRSSGVYRDTCEQTAAGLSIKCAQMCPTLSGHISAYLGIPGHTDFSLGVNVYVHANGERHKLRRGSGRGSHYRCRWWDSREPRVREESARQAGQGGAAPNDRRVTRTQEDDEGRWGARQLRGGSIFAPCRLVEGRDRARRASAARAMT
ncbi:hypothetical protein B0H13DRAFT_2288622 [Mycena leptocephala]|nr:hypothetical protein B0H13DRAFT_2288622 [Mycena leptocephala]